MEIVSLRDVPATYATTWFAVANSTGWETVKINDDFRAAGTLEILGVENMQWYPVPGASRILFRRGEHASPVEMHRAGQVFTRIEKEVMPNTSAPGPVPADMTAEVAGERSGLGRSQEPAPAMTPPSPQPIKRGPGRPRKVVVPSLVD